MAKFLVFKNANPPFEGTDIVLNVDEVVSIYRDLTKENKVALWSKENFWHVEEDFNTVMEKIGLDFREEVKKKEVN
tara:strand:+ start:237 stop:464 length:228 start_codon:yes stop_codon:yes gene_type:complete